MPKLMLDRAAISRLAQGVPQTISALERVFGDVDGTLPTTIEEANALAGQALAVAQGALASLAVLAEAIAQLDAAPAPLPQIEQDDTAPRPHLGTMASQNADQVEISGGTAALSTLLLSSQLTSSAPNGTPPFAVASTTRVTGLNVARAGTADALTSPSTFPGEAIDLDTAIILVNALRAAAISKGL